MAIHLRRLPRFARNDVLHSRHCEARRAVAIYFSKNPIRGSFAIPHTRSTNAAISSGLTQPL